MVWFLGGSGTLSFFGAGEGAHAGHGAHAADAVTRTFEVSRPLGSLLGESGGEDDLDLVFEATTGVQGEKADEVQKLFRKESGIVIERIELAAR
jgi:hypothetical protein